jgi:hypothetical protein
LKFHRVSLIVSIAGISASVAAAGLSGCAGKLADPEEFAYLAGGGGTDAGGGSPEAGGGTGCTAAAAAAVPTTIFQPICGASGCHNPTSIASMSGLDVHGLDLYSTGWASRLVNVPSVEMPGDDLISSTDPESSYLLIKLEPAPPTGVQMPYGLMALTSQQQGCVLAWIESVIGDAGPPATTDSGSADSTSQSAPDSSQSAPDSGQPVDSGHPAPDSGGAVDSAAADAGPPTFTNIYTKIFSANGCTTHHSGGATGGLNMTTQAMAYTNLVGVAATDICAGKGDRVVKGSAATSLLYLLVSETTPPCGQQMPIAGPYLSAAQQATIANWINEGANND